MMQKLSPPPPPPFVPEGPSKMACVYGKTVALWNFLSQCLSVYMCIICLMIHVIMMH